MTRRTRQVFQRAEPSRTDTMRRNFITHVAAMFSTLRELYRGSAQPPRRAMDEDGEVDSQSELSPCSLSCWMMKNLLHQETTPNERLSLSLADTVLLQDGHLFHWLFTSSKSGRVVKVCIKFEYTSPMYSCGLISPQIVILTQTGACASLLRRHSLQLASIPNTRTDGPVPSTRAH